MQELGKELRRRGHDVTVLTSDMYCDTPLVRLQDRGSPDGTKVRHSTTLTLPGEADFPVYPGMLIDALREKADVLHVHGYGCFQTMITPLLRKLRRVKTVFTTHFHPDYSDWGGPRRAGLRRLYDRFVGPYTTKGADELVVHTEFERSLLRQNGLVRSTQNIHVIPSGIRIEEFLRTPDPTTFRDSCFPGAGDRLILYVGRVAPKKGLDTLLDCAPAVLRLHPKARFLIVGEDMGLGGWVRSEIDSRGLGRHVTVTGRLDESGLIAAYHACEMLVLPSEYEAFGLVLAEAMACGKPCVATRVGGVPEVVEDRVTGLLVPPREPAALAGAIGSLLGDVSLARMMGESGQKRVQERFSLGRMVDRIEAVYSS